MVCPYCTKENPKGSQYCNRCGKSLTFTCLVSNPPTMACVYCHKVDMCPNGVKKNI